MTMSDSYVQNPSNQTTILGGIALGQALEQGRARLGYSLATAAVAIGISERLLGQIEAGLRTPNEGILVAICERFGLDRDRLGTRAYVERVAPHLNDDESILWLGWLPIHLPEGYDTEYILQAVASTIRTMRSLQASQPVYLRSTDVPLLVTLIDVEDPNLITTLVRHLGLTMHEAIEEIERMQEVSNASSTAESGLGTTKSSELPQPVRVAMPASV